MTDLPTQTNVSAGEVTRGGLLLTLAGKKTRTIGNTGNVEQGQLVFLNHFADKELRVPVVIDSVLAAKPFNEITDAEITEAGFTGRDGLLERLAIAQLGKAHHSGNTMMRREDIDVTRYNINRGAGQFGQYTFHLATPAELAEKGYDAKAIAGELASTVKTIRSTDARDKASDVVRDLSLIRAERLAGQHLLYHAVDQGVKSVAPATGLSAA